MVPTICLHLNGLIVQKKGGSNPQNPSPGYTTDISGGCWFRTDWTIPSGRIELNITQTFCVKTYKYKAIYT